MPHRKMSEDNGNQHRSGLREDRWLQNQRAFEAHFFPAGSRWGDPSPCGKKRNLADGIVTDPKRFCAKCVTAVG